jgi:16S rRNA (guanine(966)-N(2))-methyltransferase RsmD
MRIIGGQYKGRRLNTPQLSPTRPTTDFAREALFNILENNFDLSEVKFLDLFAGTGAISFEMASRGCNDITLVENFEGCINFIKKTIVELKTSAIKVQRADVFRFIENCGQHYDIIFADAPYKMSKLSSLPDLILQKNMLKENGWLIIEHSLDNDFRKHSNFIQQRKYGSTIFAVFGI